MPIPRRSTSDVPEFDTYPAASSGVGGRSDIGTMASAGEITDPERLLPREEKNPELDRTASRIGSAMGRVVSIARNPMQRVRDIPQRLSSLKDDLRGRIRDLRNDVGDTAGDWKENARQRTQMMRRRTIDYTNEKPFHVIAGAAVAAFCLGVGLRIWRATND